VNKNLIKIESALLSSLGSVSNRSSLIAGISLDDDPLCAISGRSGYHVAVNVEGPAYSLSSMLMIKSRGKIVSLVCMSSSIVHQ